MPISKIVVDHPIPRVNRIKYRLMEQIIRIAIRDGNVLPNEMADDIQEGLRDVWKTLVKTQWWVAKTPNDLLLENVKAAITAAEDVLPPDAPDASISTPGTLARERFMIETAMASDNRSLDAETIRRGMVEILPSVFVAYLVAEALGEPTEKLKVLKDRFEEAIVLA